MKKEKGSILVIIPIIALLIVSIGVTVYVNASGTVKKAEKFENEYNKLIEP